MIDPTPFIGLPYLDHGRGPVGYDCWGLVRLVYQQIFNINLPSFVDGYQSASWDVEGVAALVTHERQRWKQVSEPLEGDVVVLRVMQRPRHVGIVINSEVMLHSLAGHDSAIERFSPKWSRRIDGFYRYVA